MERQSIYRSILLVLVVSTTLFCSAALVAAAKQGRSAYGEPGAGRFPQIIYVDGRSTGANDGSSWADAYVYLQDALAEATTAEKPVEIRVAQGVYKPDQGANQTPADRAATFQLLDGVTLKGGYAGLARPDPDARDIALYATILSGDLAGNDVDVNNPAALQDEPSRADNSYHVVTGSGTDETAVLNGFSIIAGNANGPGSWDDGAGMYNVFCSATVANCTFYANAAVASGAGMFNLDSNATLANCTFARNAASEGGAISNRWQSELILVDCVFSDNYASRYGAIQNEVDSTAELVNCTFIDNHTAWYGYGGAIGNEGSSLTLTGCRFSGNSAGRAGGAVFSHLWATLKLIDCTLIENSADERGGAVSNDGILTATDCTFARNYLTHSARPWSNEGGGAIYNGSDAEVTGCIFEANAAFKGGAVFNSWVSNKATFAECRFSHNTASHPGEHADWCAGGAIWNESSHFRLSDCSFTANATSGSGGALYNDSSALRLRKCCFTGNSALKHGGGVFSNTVNASTLVNCLFTGNKAQQGGALYLDLHTRFPGNFYAATITNCTFASNWATAGSALNCALLPFNFPLEITNSIFWDEPDAISVNDMSKTRMAYSDFEGGWPGLGNLDVDPCFASPGYWADASDPSITVEPDDPNAVWIDGDYHLMSQAGRWDPETQTWIKDDVTSPCIDAGAPQSPIGYEPFPNGGYLNMGAYGGTAEASKSYFGEPICETIVAGDINGDCKVDVLDLARMACNWLGPGPLTLNQAPIVTITEPQDGQDVYFHNTATLVIVRAEATGIAAPVVAVKFLAYYSSEGHHHGTGTTDFDGSDGWQFKWRWGHDSPEGHYTISASALDDEGNFAVSQPVVVTVHGPE